MVERNFDESDVKAVLANPVRGTYEPAKRDRIEHFGYATNGRLLNVVTNRSKTVVITVVEQ